MVQRKRFEAPGDYSIAVAAELMKDGKWLAVATIQQATETGERNIDLPIADTRFATEEEAESFEVSRAREWIERNAPTSMTR
ncbi:MAG TPA: hypothetical protein VNC82_18855 [Candidatus Limnocylindria bacterium]|nr:hypothetical protein [Candidatus Limnocylindria bacterium]